MVERSLMAIYEEVMVRNTNREGNGARVVTEERKVGFGPKGGLRW